VTEDRTGTGAGAQSRRWWAGLAANLALGGVALVAALLVCELALRLLGVSFPVYVWTDPVRGAAHIPGASGGPRLSDGHSQIEINSRGWRGPETAFEHPAGTYRIALLGDSYIEAFEVPFEQTVGQVLAHRLSTERGTPVEVLNFGVGGYGTTQEQLTLQHEVWKYAPDLVLLAVTTGNDISDNYRPLKKTDYVPYYVAHGSRLVLDTSFRQSKELRDRAIWTRRLLGLVEHSRLVQLGNRVRHLRRKGERQQANAGGGPEDELGLHQEIYLPPTTPDWQQAWTVTEGILRMMRDDCRRRHTPFALVTITNGIQVTPRPAEKAAFMQRLGVKDLYYPERRLREFGAREGIPVLNLAPAMAAQAEEQHVFFHADHGTPGIGHWNAAGHQAAGELIADWVAKEFPAPATVARP
jgi:lysophospholipase L1-like esterase